MTNIDIISSKTLSTRDTVDFCNILSFNTDIETTILISNGTRNCNAKSLIGLLSAKIQHGNKIIISAHGGDEELAIELAKSFLTE